MLSKLSVLLSLPDISPAIADSGVRNIASFGVLATLIILLAFEARVALRHPGRKHRFRLSVRANLGLLFFNDLALSALSATSLLVLAEHYSGRGLLVEVKNPLGYALLGFLLLDFALYLWHWANHRFEALWMFHKVHHSDRFMNASTAFRLHIMEVLLTLLAKAAFIVATGVETRIVLLNEAIMALFVIAHHSSLSMPGEKWLGLLFVTPRLHRAHHSTRRQEHDRNYGQVFSIWDRLFGTLTEVEPARVGLKNIQDQTFLDLLKFGFARSLSPVAQDLTPLIAEAAYFKAEQRGFAPGFEMLDWLDAEREIRCAYGRHDR